MLSIPSLPPAGALPQPADFGGKPAVAAGFLTVLVGIAGSKATSPGGKALPFDDAPPLATDSATAEGWAPEDQPLPGSSPDTPPMQLSAIVVPMLATIAVPRRDALPYATHHGPATPAQPLARHFVQLPVVASAARPADAPGRPPWLVEIAAESAALPVAQAGDPVPNGKPVAAPVEARPLPVTIPWPGLAANAPTEAPSVQPVAIRVPEAVEFALPPRFEHTTSVAAPATVVLPAPAAIGIGAPGKLQLPTAAPPAPSTLQEHPAGEVPPPSPVPSTLRIRPMAPAAPLAAQVAGRRPDTEATPRLPSADTRAEPASEVALRPGRAVATPAPEGLRPVAPTSAPAASSDPLAVPSPSQMAGSKGDLGDARPAQSDLAASPAPLPGVLDGASQDMQRTPAPTSSARAAPARQHDFAVLIDRLVEARQAASDRPVGLALTHPEFGPVKLDFHARGPDLVVAASSSDPGFGPAAVAAIATGSDAPGHREDPRANPGSAGNGFQASSSPGHDRTPENGTARRSSDPAESRTEAAATRPEPRQSHRGRGIFV